MLFMCVTRARRKEFLQAATKLDPPVPSKYLQLSRPYNQRFIQELLFHDVIKEAMVIHAGNRRRAGSTLAGYDQHASRAYAPGLTELLAKEKEHD